MVDIDTLTHKNCQKGVIFFFWLHFQSTKKEDNITED